MGPRGDDSTEEFFFFALIWTLRNSLFLITVTSFRPFYFIPLNNLMVGIDPQFFLSTSSGWHQVSTCCFVRVLSFLFLWQGGVTVGTIGTDADEFL